MEAQLKERFALDVRFEEVDLYGLVGGERTADAEPSNY